MDEIGDLTFEQAFAELEETVRKLEAGGLALEESLALFERGQALAAHCNVQLDEAELKVRQLSVWSPISIMSFPPVAWLSNGGQDSAAENRNQVPEKRNQGPNS